MFVYSIAAADFYSKKAQKCYCMTESCRGWIGEEEDETEADAVEDKEETVQETGVEVEDSKVKTKPKVERKKRKNIQLEDMAVSFFIRLSNILIPMMWLKFTTLF